MVELKGCGQFQACSQFLGFQRPVEGVRADCVPTLFTVTVSIPCPTLSISSRIESLAVMLARDDTLIWVSPAFTGAVSHACVPGLPTAVTVTTSYF